MPSFEEAIHKIENLISVQKEDREAFTKDYDAIRNYLMDIMQQTDPVFKQIYNGSSLFGSYPENLKIEEPNEFDVHFMFKLPFHKDIQIERDTTRPGFVKLIISKPLLLMRDDPNLRFVYEQFKKFINKSNYLLRKEVQNWLERIITKAMNTYGNSVRNAAGTEIYTLKYKKKGTAHTIKASSKGREISMDFVPAFRFNANKDWFADKAFPKDASEKFWFAVPKPSVGRKRGRGLTFSICVPQTEKHLLSAKYNLKPSLRLFKSIRENGTNGYLIRSYFIRTIYMLENDKQEDAFWMQPPGKLLLHMVSQLLGYLEKSYLPFYWCPTMNLMAGIREDQASDLRMLFQNIKQELEFFSNQSKVDYKKIRQLFGNSLTKL